MQFEIFTISSLRHKLSLTLMLKWPGCSRLQIMCCTSSTYHVQHVMFQVVYIKHLCATCHVSGGIHQALIMCNMLHARCCTSSTYHVQHVACQVLHIKHLSCATCHVSGGIHQALMCNMSCFRWYTSSTYHVQHVACQVVRKDSSCIKFDRV